MPVLSSFPVQRRPASKANPGAKSSSSARSTVLGLGLKIASLTIAGLSAAACGIPASQAETLRAQDHTPHSHNAEPVRCAVEMDAHRGGTHIAARVTADHAVSGTYEFTLTNHALGGRSTLRQSGEFQANSNAPTILSESRMPGRPADQNATLTLRIGGQTLTCGETVL